MTEKEVEGLQELTLQDLQKVSLEILKEVHKFCVENGIHYSLGYGTLLGAIRHKGFIPWDDDVDIYMPRPDYDRFCRIFRHNDLEVVSRITRKDCLIAFARVCDIRKTCVFSYIPWIRNQGNLGYWIDIFPLDDVQENPEKAHKEAFSVHHALIKSRKSARPWYVRQESFKYNFNTWKKKLFSLFCKKPETYAEMLDNMIRTTWGNTALVTQMAYPDVFTLYDAADFKSYHEMSFEDTTLMVADGYKDLLEITYGDYMTPPPVEQRKPKQSYIHFYWRVNPDK